MASEPITYGKFDYIGDTYTLVLQPLKNVTSIQSYIDVTSNIIPLQRYFIKEFRYKINNGSFGAWTILDNVNLQAIAIVPEAVLVMEVRYTRTGAEAQGSIRWKEFRLNNVQVQPNIVIRINKTNYDTVYGTSKYTDIANAISKLSDWTTKELGFPLYLQNDGTLLEQKIMISNTIGTSTDNDLNVLLKTEFGKRITKLFFDLDIDVNKPKT